MGKHTAWTENYDVVCPTLQQLLPYILTHAKSSKPTILAESRKYPKRTSPPPVFLPPPRLCYQACLGNDTMPQSSRNLHLEILKVNQPLSILRGCLPSLHKHDHKNCMKWLPTVAIGGEMH